MFSREPILRQVDILDLQPGQITVGMHEVAMRRESWQKKLRRDRAGFLGSHEIPIIRGPKVERGKKKYRIRLIYDHHHLTRGLFDEGQRTVNVTVWRDLGHVKSEEEFWYYIDSIGLIHPYDEHGHRRNHKKLPKTIKDLVDDPYRSLAWQVRRLGGYAKDATSFSEFLWADFFRRRISHKDVRTNFANAAQEAYGLARSKDADHLPGWCGPVVD